METQNETEKAVPSPAPTRKGGFGETVRFMAIVLAIVVLVRVFIAQPFVVSGTSMVPTFQNNNYLIVDEISYRFKSPARGDVIVFRPPYEKGVYLIKRVIGIPGDTVVIKNGAVTIKNTAHPDGVVLSEDYITRDNGMDDMSVVVPDGQYFVMGDNRPVSYDSRRWGLLPRENITGRALFRLFPIREFNVFPGERHIEA